MRARLRRLLPPCDPAFQRTLGFTEEELLAEPYLSFVHPDDRAASAADLGSLARGEQTGVFEERHLHKDGTYRWLHWSAVSAGDGGSCYAVARDITERKQAEAGLAASRARIVAAADEARRKIERDLHDGAQQRLVGLALQLTVARMDAADARTAALLDELSRELQLALAELRDLARGIHPAILTDFGLETALEGLADRAPVPVELHVDVPERLTPSLEAAAYFIASEALTNVAKYARASSASVHVTRVEDRVLIEVRDDGVGGADPGAAAASAAWSTASRRSAARSRSRARPAAARGSGRSSPSLPRPSACECRGERVTAAAQHRLPVRHQEQLDREVEERLEGVAEHRAGHARDEPRVGADADAAGTRAEQDVSGDERPVRGDPEELLRAVHGRLHLDPAREPVAAAERLVDFDALPRLLCPARRRPDARSWVASADHRRAADVPEERQQDLGRPMVGDVVVERPPEPLLVLVLGRHERVDQDERVLLDEREGRDLGLPPLGAPLLLGPLRVRRRPAPEPRPQLLDLIARSCQAAAAGPVPASTPA